MRPRVPPIGPSFGAGRGSIVTDQPMPSPAALAKANAICKKHGMLPGGMMARSLAEDLEAYAREWTQAASADARRQVESVLMLHYGAVHSCAVEDLVEILSVAR